MKPSVIVLDESVEEFDPFNARSVPGALRRIGEEIGDVCGEGYVAIVAAEGTVNVREPLLASIVRLVEEYGVSAFLIVSSVSARDVVHQFVRMLVNLLSPLSVRLLHVIVEGNAAVAARRLRKLMEYLCSVCRGIVTCVSPAPRYLAAAVTAASLPLHGEECEAAVVHINFWFGPWKGLAYPLAPRSHEPLEVIHPAGLTPSYRHVVDTLSPSLEGLMEYLGVESRLHRCIARLAYRLNLEVKGGVVLEPDGFRCSSCPVELDLCGHTVRVDNWCEPLEWIKALGKLVNIVEHCKGVTSNIVNAVFEASGACRWIVAETDCIPPDAQCTPSRGGRWTPAYRHQPSIQGVSTSRPSWGLELQCHTLF